MPVDDASPTALLHRRLRAAGIDDVVHVAPVSGGLAATAGLARRSGAPSGAGAAEGTGTTVFVKAFAEPPSDDAFEAEAEGLAALRTLGGVTTPEVLVVTPEVLVLEALRPRPADAGFWERLAHALARLHTGTTHERFGWHRDNWLGRRRQVNTWTDDGFEFFAQHRLLRWLGEPRVDAALGPADRAALEHLCDRLPELLPERPACLTHGDLWAQNVLSTADGRPALIDPAVSYTWAEVDLAHLWTTARPPEAAASYDLYAELTGLDRGWRERMPVLQLRQHLAVIAQFDDDWGAADLVRATLAPFRRRP